MLFAPVSASFLSETSAASDSAPRAPEVSSIRAASPDSSSDVGPDSEGMSITAASEEGEAGAGETTPPLEDGDGTITGAEVELEALGVAEALGAGVTEDEALAEGDGAGIAAGQTGSEITLLSSVTAPFLASALPSMVASVVTEIDVSARIDPLKVEFVPRVAELPTCQ